MGRKIERAVHTVGLMHWTLTPPQAQGRPSPGFPESALLEALLEIADSAMTYRRRYLSGVQMAAVLDLLIADESNPRSLAFQLTAMREVIEQLPHDPQQAVRAAEQRMVVSLLTAVQLTDILELARTEADGRRPRLDQFLADLHQDLPLLADAISHHYLSHLQTSRQLAEV